MHVVEALGLGVVGMAVDFMRTGKNAALGERAGILEFDPQSMLQTFCVICSGCLGP